MPIYVDGVLYERSYNDESKNPRAIPQSTEHADFWLVPVASPPTTTSFSSSSAKSSSVKSSSVFSTTREVDLGYSLINICQPKFIWFECTGLRPNTPHWIFFNGVEVTKFVRTGIDRDTFDAYPKNDPIRNPGDRYLSATSYPSELGGPTAASGPLTSNTSGVIYGLFYIQSNETVNFPTGTNLLYALDVSAFRPENSFSLAKGSYTALAQYEYYYENSKPKTPSVAVSNPTYEASIPSRPSTYSRGDYDGGEPAQYGNFQGPNLDGTAGYTAQINDPGGPGGGDGDGCFTPNTLVDMADGSTKKIVDIKIGDKVWNKDKTDINEVKFVEVVDGSEFGYLYSPGNEEPFATVNHPMFINDQIVAGDAEIASYHYPWLTKQYGAIKQLSNVKYKTAPSGLVYNLWLDGDGTYIVNGYGTTSIVGDGGLASIACEKGYLTSEEVVTALKHSLQHSQELSYGAYLVNKMLGQLNWDPVTKAVSSIIHTLENPNSPLSTALKVVGFAALVVDGKKTLFKKTRSVKTKSST